MISPKNNKKLKGLNTNHGKITLPFFMPDATRAVVKGLDISDINTTKTNALVVNTLHLYLQPGLKTIKKAGGVHKFMEWSGPLLSDSGGFQVFSLIHKNSNMGKITDDGAVFKSPINGASHTLTPEKSIQIQFDLGTDMMVVLDDCPPHDYSKEKVEEAVDRTIAWAKRCKIEFNKQIKKRRISKVKRPLLFGVIQGGLHRDLRAKCAQGLFDIDFDGYGLGGRPVDTQGDFAEDILDYTAKLIPDDKPKFALGTGTPEDIVRCYKMGWNIFDCVIPTREGRHGRLFYFNNKKITGNKNFYKTVNINNAKFTNNFKKINSQSSIKQLREYSLSYLHHLFKAKDPLGAKLASLNNLEFYRELMKKIK